MTKQRITMIFKGRKSQVIEWGKLFIFSLVVALIDPFAVAMKRAFSSESRNIDSMFAIDLLVPIILSMGLAMFSATIFTVIFYRRRTEAFIASALFVMACWNFEGRFLQQLSNVQSLVPINFETNWPYSIIFCAILIIIFSLVASQFSKLIKGSSKVYEKIPQFLFSVAIFVLVFNAQGTIVFLFKTKAQRDYRPPALSSNQDLVLPQDLPDIYYIVLDRHSNVDVLREQLNYDNSGFTKELRQQDYYVNDRAFAAYPYTAMSIGSTMSAIYLGDLEKQYANTKDQTHSLLFNLTRYGSVPIELKKLGYQYSVIGSWYGVSNKAPLADNFYYEHIKLLIGDKRIYVNEIDKYALLRSVFSETLRITNNLTSLSDSDQARYQLGTLNDIASSDKQGGRFVFAHVLLPHTPYVFNADGSLANYDPGDNNNGVSEKQKYLNQLEFVDQQITQLVQNINEKSKGKAIVILQSDEGYYPQYMLQQQSNIKDVFKEMMSGDMSNWSDAYLKAKYGILAAYHLPGVSEEEISKGANSTNIFRLILNHYFNYELPYLPICNFALNEGRNRAFTYTNITARFNSNPDPACRTIHD